MVLNEHLGTLQSSISFTDYQIFCTATISKDTMNTEDSDNEIIHNGLIPTFGLLL